MKDETEVAAPPAASTAPPTTTLRRYTFALTLTDRPGGMELIAATFAHRGVSIHSTLGNDGALDPDGRAQVIITFSATPARKEALKGALSRLSRVVALAEHTDDDNAVYKTALLRIEAERASDLADAAAVLNLAHLVITTVLDRSGRHHFEYGEATYTVTGPPPDVDALIADLKARHRLRAAAHATLAL